MFDIMYKKTNRNSLVRIQFQFIEFPRGVVSKLTRTRTTLEK